MKHTKPLLAVLLSLAAATACESFDGPTAPADANREEAAEPDPELVATSDEVYADVARKEVPGFAGFYLLEDGTPVIRLKNPESRFAAVDYVEGEIKALGDGRNTERLQESAIILEARYDFAELKASYDTLQPLLDREDVFTMDIDEVENLVHVGVQDEGSIDYVRKFAMEHGVPEDGLHVEVQPAPEARQTVRDWTGTLRGGYQIAFSGGLCTLGFNAWWNGGWVHVTNSHCTPQYFASDGGTIWQPTAVAGNQIGWEVKDRGRYRCTWWIFSSCRRADAAYIRINGTRALGQGQIARTAWNTGGPGGLTVTGTFDIVARYSGSTPVGMWLDKTGRTSGSTYGRVTRSCVSIGRLKCQDVSRVWSQPGDSGSPMHYWVGGSNTRLQGILWGGPSGDWTTTYSSRLSGIEQDLGGLSALCRPGYGC